MYNQNNIIRELSLGARQGKHALNAVPGLLRQILRENMWQSFPIEGSDQLHEPEDFENFVTAPPPYGLGGTIELLKFYCADHLDVMDMIEQVTNPTIEQLAWEIKNRFSDDWIRELITLLEKND